MKKLISSVIVILLIMFFDLAGADVNNPLDPPEKLFISSIKPDSKIILKWDSLKIVNPKNDQDFYYTDATVTVYIIDSVALFNYARSIRQSFSPDKFFTKQFISGLVNGTDLNKKEYVSELYYSQFYFMLLIDGNAPLTYEKPEMGLKITIKAVKAVPDKYAWFRKDTGRLLKLGITGLFFVYLMGFFLYYRWQFKLTFKSADYFYKKYLALVEKKLNFLKMYNIKDYPHLQKKYNALITSLNWYLVRKCDYETLAGKYQTRRDSMFYMMVIVLVIFAGLYLLFKFFNLK